jgi:hypothetical protein
VVTLVSALAAISPKVANTFGLTSLAAIQTAVESIFGTIAVLAPVLGTIWRARSNLQPLTLTKASAAAHPATVSAAVAAMPISQAPAAASAPIVDPAKPWGK